MVNSIPVSKMKQADPTQGPKAKRPIMVVDDSRFQRRVLSATLRKRGYEVVEADSGAEALAMIEKTPVDMVISDWIMPGMSGLELCAALRNRPDVGYTYLILLTSKAEKAEIAAGLNAGADDFLTKPVNGSELEARIRAGERLLDMERALVVKNDEVSYALDQIQTLYDAIDRDLQEAKTLQQSLLRDKDAVFGPAKLSLMLQSSGHVGGDLTGFFRINDRYLGLYGLDVSGHGISSALMTARLAGLLSGATPGQNLALGLNEAGETVPRNPEGVAAELNEMLLFDMETQHYFTILLATLDLETGDLHGVQAGHPHPLLYRKRGKMEVLGDGGLPIGLIPGATYDPFYAKMRNGDRLVLMSDGVTEATTPDGEMLDTDGAIKFLRRQKRTETRFVFPNMVNDLHEYTGEAAFEDDVSGLVLDFDHTRAES